MIQPAPARSFLFVPASRPERLPKAFAAGADAVVADWEDAVSAAQKAEARRNMAEHAADESHPPVWLRINAAGSAEYAADVAAAAALPRLAGILLPKAEHAADIEALHRATRKPVMPVLETARGLLNLPQIAAAEGVQMLTYGCLDFAHDVGLRADGAMAETFFDHIRLQLLLHSAANNLQQPLDTVFPDFKNAEALQKRVARWRDLGMGGMLCIHPSQIAVVHETLRPKGAELDFARRVLAEHERGGAAAFQLDGKMVDMPVILAARELVRRYGG